MTKPLVIINDAQLTRMALNSTFTDAFPFLLGLREVARTTGCGRCARKRNAGVRTNAYSAAKAAIGNMGSESKRRLKELLDTRQVSITYLVGGRRRILKF